MPVSVVTTPARPNIVRSPTDTHERSIPPLNNEPRKAPILRLLNRAKTPLPSPKLVVEMMEFLLQAKDANDVAHRAAAALGLLPTVRSSALIEREPEKSADCSVELGPSTHADESGTRFLTVELTDEQDDEHRDFVNNIMSLARTVYGRTLMSQRLADQAYTDALTSVWNRRGFVPLFNQALARVARDGSAVTLLICDIDHFKVINDTLGHDAGDAALCHVTSAIQHVLRPSDVVARIGGDELAILLAGANCAGGLRVAERLRAFLASNPCRVGNLTLSIGITDTSMAVGSRTRERRQSMFKAADAALYEAKRAGRNRACVGRPTLDASA